MKLENLYDLATGLRQGELLALNWENKTLNVNKSVTEVHIYEGKNNKHAETIFQIPKAQTLLELFLISIPDVLNMC